MNNSNPIVTLSHETGIILSKQSSESDIKRYFNKVLELSKSDNEFPINLDEVWMLVYGRKADATDALQHGFIENVDYQLLRQNPQQKQKRGGHNRIGNMKFISEGNIYRLIVKSHMPKADEFESWVFDDVVPSVI